MKSAKVKVTGKKRQFYIIYFKYEQQKQEINKK